MKILQVAYKSTISGGEKVLFDLAVSLRRRGHEVLSVCPDPGQLPARLAAEGIRTKIIHFHKTYDLATAVRLARFIRKEKIEVLHSHSMLTNILSRTAGRLAGIPVSVSTEHLTMELARGGRGKGWWERFKALCYRRLDNSTSRFNGAVIAVSNAVREDLLEQGMDPHRAIVIKNGIEIPPLDPGLGSRVRAELGIAPDTPVIGTVGRLSPQKDYPTLLKAAAGIIAAVPRAIFLILGDGDLRVDLEKLAGELGIGERVRFLGYRENVMDAVAAFDIFALASLWEGLPLAVLEAMALARPVVATAVPGTVEALEDGETGFAVPLKVPSALAEKIIELVRDPEKSRKMGVSGRRRVEESFSRERMVDEHESLYRRLLRQRTR
jgi:L-malate glycosyltransferase